jgi:hypothetical protein
VGGECAKHDAGFRVRRARQAGSAMWGASLRFVRLKARGRQVGARGEQRQQEVVMR